MRRSRLKRKRFKGTEGQDRESYSDTQDRENYYIEPVKKYRKHRKV